MGRQMSNDEIFLKYQPELLLKIHNEINLKSDIALDVYRDFIMVIKGKGERERMIPLHASSCEGPLQPQDTRLELTCASLWRYSS